MLRRLLLVATGQGSFPFTPPLPGTDDIMVGCSVYRTTDYTSQADNDDVEFDSVEYDTTGGDLWDIGDPTKITIPAALDGWYPKFHVEAIWVGGTGGTYRELKLFKNGDKTNPYAILQSAPANGNTGLALESRRLPPVSTGDYFTTAFRSGSNQTVLAEDFYSMYFSVEFSPPS